MKFDKVYCGKAAEYLKTIIPFEPEIGIILGSGLGPLSSSIEDPIVIPYADIPNFLTSTVSSRKNDFWKNRRKTHNVYVWTFPLLRRI